MRKVHIFADSTCDLSEELIEKNSINVIPLCIVLDDKSYYDKVEITPEQIFKWSRANGRTPKTAAASLDGFMNAISKYMEADDDIIFIGIAEGMSTTCNVARLVGDEFDTGRLFVIDSKNLSTGIGLQVLRAAEMAADGKSAEEIVKSIEDARDKVRASFVVDTLDFLAMGGRCSGVTAFLANSLKLHPSIFVIDGKMEVGKKYRGNMNKALINYLKDLDEEISNADSQRIFITHSGASHEIVEQIRQHIEKMDKFGEINITTAGGVISSHCGPGTLGILYYMK